MEVTAPAWAVAAAGAIVLLGGALLGFYGKWRRENIAIRGESAKATVEEKRAQSDYEIHVRDDAIVTWKNYADAAALRAHEAEARSDRKDSDWNMRVEGIVSRYREREALMVKQFQERELQFQSIVDKIRVDNDAKIDLIETRHDQRLSALIGQHETCIRDNAEMKGRMSEMERAREEDRKRIEEIQARLDARDMKRGGKRRDDNDPNADHTINPVH